MKTHLLTMDFYIHPARPPIKTLKLYITQFTYKEPNERQFFGGLFFGIKVSSKRELYKLYKFLENSHRLLVMSESTPNLPSMCYVDGKFKPWVYKPFLPNDLIILCSFSDHCLNLTIK